MHIKTGAAIERRWLLAAASQDLPLTWLAGCVSCLPVLRRCMQGQLRTTKRIRFPHAW